MGRSAAVSVNSVYFGSCEVFAYLALFRWSNVHLKTVSLVYDTLQGDEVYGVQVNSRKRPEGRLNSRGAVKTTRKDL